MLLIKYSFLGASLLTATAKSSPPMQKMSLSPHVLTDCGCNAVITNFLGCQNLTEGGHDCVCQDSWYGNSTGCLNCLMLADDPLDLPCSNDFFGNFGEVLTNVFAACTTTGGSVSTNGSAVCGRATSGYDACVYFNPMAGGESWATMEDCCTGNTLTGFFELHLGHVPGINDTQPIVSTNTTTYPSYIPPASTWNSTLSPTSPTAVSGTLAPFSGKNGTAPTGYSSPVPSAGNSSVPTSISNSASPMEPRAGVWASVCVVFIGAVAAFL